MPDSELCSGAEAAYTALTDCPPDLARVVEAWPALPEHIKAAIAALVKAGEVG